MFNTNEEIKRNKMRKAEEILVYFKEWNIDDETKIYLKFHCRRYEFLLKKVNEIIAKIREVSENELLRILDIGPAFQTEILRQTLPGVIVNTLGVEDQRFKFRPQDKHFQFDLNDSQYQEKWPRIEEHNLVIMAEVIEHLYTSPKLVLACIKTWLKKNGYLIIQTPNAVSLRKRIKMLSGKHPYETIRETRTNPGHFREYTIKELLLIGKELGFVPIGYTTCNYFGGFEGIKGVIYNILGRFLPKTFRDGITICFRRS